MSEKTAPTRKVTFATTVVENDQRFEAGKSYRLPPATAARLKWGGLVREAKPSAKISTPTDLNKPSTAKGTAPVPPGARRRPTRVTGPGAAAGQRSARRLSARPASAPASGHRWAPPTASAKR